MSNLKKTLLGSILLVGESIGKKLVGLVSTLILARILVPEDFGLIAIATLLVGLLDVFSQTGGGQYVLRADEKDVTDSLLNTHFTINLALRTGLAVLLFFSAPFVSEFYEDERLTLVVIAFSLLMIIQSANNPGMLLLKRKQEYTLIVKISIFSKIVGVSAAISAALSLQNYWALIIGQYSSSIILLIGSYWVHSYRPKLEMSNARQQWQFSSWIIIQSMMGYLRTQSDSLLVSALFGKADLGSYHTMKYLAFIPCGQILNPLTQPLLVELSKLRDNRTYFATQFNVTFLVTMIIALPLTMFLYTFNELVVAILLGDNWKQYAHLFGIFCLVIPAYAVFHQANRAVYVFSETRISAIYEAISVVSLIAILIIADTTDVTFYASLKIGLETIFSISYLSYISGRYNGIVSTLKMYVLLLPVVIACVIASLLPNKIERFDIVLVDLFFSGLAFFIVYGIVLFSIHVIMRKRSTEWGYLDTVLFKVLKMFR